MSNGYVKLHRELLSSIIWQNPNITRVFLWCLLKASYCQHEVLVGQTRITLQPGQFVFGRFKAGEELGMPPTTVVDSMKFLVRNKTIVIKSTNKYSLVTLVNWASYQSDESESVTNLVMNPSLVTNPSSNRHQSVTYKKGKERKELLVESVHRRLAELLRERITAWLPSAKVPANLDAWANELRLAMVQDGRTEQELESVIRWATADSFWRGNILSAKKLREKFDQLQGKMMQAKPTQPAGRDYSKLRM